MATATTTAIMIICALGLLTGCDNHRSRDSQDREVSNVATPSPDPSESPSDDTPVETVDGFAITAHFPQINDQNIALVSGVTITFSEPILDESYNSDLVQLILNGAPISGVLEKSSDDSLHFNPETLCCPIPPIKLS